MTTSEIAGMLGRKGGRARARRLPSAERSRIAALGGAARAESILAARRIKDNLAYAQALRHLAPSHPVARMSSCPGPLPDVVK